MATRVPPKIEDSINKYYLGIISQSQPRDVCFISRNYDIILESVVSSLEKVCSCFFVLYEGRGALRIGSIYEVKALLDDLASAEESLSLGFNKGIMSISIGQDDDSNYEIRISAVGEAGGPFDEIISDMTNTTEVETANWEAFAKLPDHLR